MSQRLKSLKRIEAVQSRLVALADLRLAQAERQCEELTQARQRLRDFIGTAEPLSAPLAKAAVRSASSVEQHLVAASANRAASQARRDACKRREHAVSAMADRERLAARRAEADKELAEILEAWLARDGASLP